MKRIILLTLLFMALLAPGVMKAQFTIPNGSFENWPTSVPKDWAVVSGNVQRETSVSYTKTNVVGTDTIKTSVNRPCYDGTSCILVQNQQVGNNVYKGLIKDSFPFTGKPNYFSMNYAYFSGNGEQCGVLIVMTHWNTTNKNRDTILKWLVGSDPGPIEPWVSLQTSSTNLTPGYTSGTPDTCHIYIVCTISNQTTLTTGVYIDQISFSDNAPTAIRLPESNNFSGINAYPNPFASITNIHYNLIDNGQVSLKVYDISGKEVATLVDGNQFIGAHDVNFDATDLKGGIYFYRLQSGTSTETGKLILSK